MKEINSKELQYVSGGMIIRWPLPDPSVPPHYYNDIRLWFPILLINNAVRQVWFLPIKLQRPSEKFRRPL